MNTSRPLRYRIRYVLDRWCIFYPLWPGLMPFETLPDACDWIKRHSVLVAKDAAREAKETVQ